jgi:endogenous inhibitor of DNA gyrase (YacG/DUF329 family)
VRFDSQTATAMPFCSERCRLIDLGRWMNEEIGIPISPEDQEGDAEDADYGDDRPPPRR